jgi:uncharacterized protein (TIGR02271 family)
MQTHATHVLGRDGLRGTLVEPERLNDPHTLAAQVVLDDGRQVWLPVSALSRAEDGTYRIPFSDADLRRGLSGGAYRTLQEGAERQAGPASPETVTRELHPFQQPAQHSNASESQVIPVVEERADVRTRRVETGAVHVHKTVSEHVQTIQTPVVNEDAEVTRVPVNRIVDGPVAIREEGDTTIIPLLEEIIMVEKRLVLREELHVRKRRIEEPHTEQITLRREEANVERRDAES